MTFGLQGAYQPIALDGSGSYDPDYDLITYAWTLAHAPVGSAAALDDPTRARLDRAFAGLRDPW